MEKTNGFLRILVLAMGLTAVAGFIPLASPHAKHRVSLTYLSMATGSSKHQYHDASSSKTTSTSGMPMATSPELIRNLAVVGHSHSGKTALIEWMLFDEHILTVRPKSGASSLDWDPTESARHSSVFSHYTRLPHAGHVLEVSDTPWGDFPCDALASLDGADAALVVVSAADGIQSGTTSAIQHCQAAGVRMMVAISKMDRPFVQVESIVDELKQVFAGLVPLQVPIGQGQSFEGVKSVLLVDDNGRVSRNTQNDDKLEQIWTELEEAVAFTDDSLIMEYLEVGQLDPDKVLKGLRKGVIQGKLVPLVYTSAERDLGVQELLDAIVTVSPNPVDMREEALSAACEEDAFKCNYEPGVEAGFSARVLHTNVDSFGSLSVLRVISNGRDNNDGSYKSLPQEVVVLRSGEKFKMPTSSACFGLIGKEKLPLTEGAPVLPGDVVAVPRLPEHVHTNDILTTPDAVQEERAEILVEEETNHLTPLSRPAEDISLMASATITLADPANNDKKSGRGGGGKAGTGGEEKLLSSLRALSREDLAMKVEQHPSGLLLVKCMSTDHLQIISQRLQQRYGLHVELGRPPIQYKETLAKEVKAVEGRHKKQSGGSGQFGVCVINMEPLEEGRGIEFVSQIKGGAITKPFIMSVEKGVREQLEGGGLLGFPVTDVRVTLIDGKMHSVDSKDIAFQSAGRLAVKAALEKGKTRLLQPMEKVIFTISEQLRGEISAIVARGQGYVIETHNIAGDGVHVSVECVLPASSISDISDYLRAASGGEAQYTSSFSHYFAVPEDQVCSILGLDKTSESKSIPQS